MSHPNSPRVSRRLRRPSVSEQVENIDFTPSARSREYFRVSGRKANGKEKKQPTAEVGVAEVGSDEEGSKEGENPTFLQQVENYVSILVIILEHIISSITTLLPKPLIHLCTVISRFIFSSFKSSNESYNNFVSESGDARKTDLLLQRVEKLRNFKSFLDICELNGLKAESHLVHTKDGFQLTLHRLNPEINGFPSNGKAVYLQHGLLMTSDVWCVMLDKNDNLPIVLCELGYDVFLGNNRGNKYSNKHVRYNASEKEFWDFSIDEFAIYDIPSSIDYILKLKKIQSLTYIGFSQGCSQILSSISINDDLNDKISKLILIAPATTPKKLSNWLINSIINFDPGMIYLLFGRKILLQSVMFWKMITFPPMFVKLIDIPNDILFNWKSKNIDIMQKLVSYYHLYSTTSVKCVVHWFQIIKSKKFQMYQEKDYFQPFEYPTDKTIKIKELMIIYGMSDSLVDIDVLVSQLPEYEDLLFTQINEGKVVGTKHLINNVEIKVNDDTESEEGKNFKDGDCSQLRVFGIKGHEHLDLLWGKNMNKNVIENVVDFVE